MVPRFITAPFAVLALVLATAVSSSPTNLSVRNDNGTPMCEGGFYYKPGPPYHPMGRGSGYKSNTWTMDGPRGLVANYDPSTKMLYLHAGSHTQDYTNIAFVVPGGQSYGVLVNRNSGCKYLVQGLAGAHVGYHLEVLYSQKVQG